jgi:hypothetical protein
MFGKASENSCDLRRRLAFSEDDLGHAISQGTVMVDFCEAEIFKGQMAETGDGIVGRDFAFAYLLEKLADGFGVQDGTQHSAVSIQLSRSLD